MSMTETQLAHYIAGVSSDWRLTTDLKLAMIRDALQIKSQQLSVNERLADARKVTPVGSSPASRFCIHNVALVEQCPHCQVNATTKGLAQSWRHRAVMLPDWVERVLWTDPPVKHDPAKEVRDADSNRDALSGGVLGGGDEPAAGGT